MSPGCSPTRCGAAAGCPETFCVCIGGAAEAMDSMFSSKRTPKLGSCQPTRGLITLFGHDIATLIKTFQFLKTQSRPVLLHVLTQKGKGFEPAMQKQKKFHGLGPYDPETGDQKNHVYVSVGHQQMMTDAMKPLGLSVWQLTTPRPMAEAGGRLFVDVTQRLASPASRAGLLEALGRSDPLIGDALQTILERDGFIRPLPDGRIVMFGSTICVAWAFGMTFVVFKAINALKTMRVPKEVELEGLDVPEFGMPAYPEDVIAAEACRIR